MSVAYAELQVTSNYSFLRGASHPEELAARAKELGLDALAITDRNTLAGVVRAHAAAKAARLPLVVGARLDLEDAPSLLCYSTDRAVYGRLSRLISLGQRRAKKGACRLTLADVFGHGDGLVIAAVPPETPDAAFAARLRALKSRFGRDLFVAAHHLYRGDDARRLARLAALARETGARLLATNDVHAHVASRRPLQDVLTCVREKCVVDAAGFRLFANAERHLKAPDEMARLFRRHSEAVEATLEIVRRCRFSLDELRYEYPVDPTPAGRTPQEELARLAWEGARRRYPDGVPAKVEALIRHELTLIEQLGYAPYFLTVHDIVAFARSRAILCQGRGSAANSAVCYCIGITAVDPSRMDLLFERFVSAERNEPPDIDVDFEHERREEVIQYIYEKYGRERAGIAATVICYRPRSALRDVGKALGLSQDAVGALAETIWGWGAEGIEPRHIRETGLDPTSPRVALAIKLARELIGFPRHLSQHVGGFVITKSRLDEVVPIANAAMEDRTFIEWDKDDLDALGILKIDVLALGMLTCIRKCFDLLRKHHRRDLDLATAPAEDPAVYEMLGRADSIGVFQVESRAQMSMLPRLRPQNFYDLVIEVAIVRPGPIQGDMVHPYLRRRRGEEAVSFPSEELREVLGKTLGVPLFQEQAMKIAIVAAGFTPSEADRLRRAMATFRRVGVIHEFRDKLIEGMVSRSYTRDFAERCFSQIEGFGTYGFPESHAASFALLVYVSAWLKCHYPAAFAAALLNSQPMGFYAPAQIVRDARDHGVETRPVDVNFSDWDCTLEPYDGDAVALRLGFRQAKGLAEEDITKLVVARMLGGPFGDVQALRRRAGLSSSTLDRLARADAFGSLALDRRAALWQGLDRVATASGSPLFAALPPPTPAPVALPAMSLGEAVRDDYASLRLSLRAHPLALLRATLDSERIVAASRLIEQRDGARLTVAGLVLVRQRPGTASGVVFVTLEDETGIANLIVWPQVFERHRRAVLGARLMAARGRLQREGIVVHLVVDRLHDRSDLLLRLGRQAADLEPPLARADEVKRPGHDPRLSDYPSRDFH
ncbi:MAG TPA: error-prone DNA polymerase [Alphaproteobacteria bacterium]|nr:error-prone DNA polymerase [Alphaproteobacteria bacterium]